MSSTVDLGTLVVPVCKELRFYCWGNITTNEVYGWDYPAELPTMPLFALDNGKMGILVLSHSKTPNHAGQWSHLSFKAFLISDIPVPLISGFIDIYSPISYSVHIGIYPLELLKMTVKNKSVSTRYAMREGSYDYRQSFHNAFDVNQAMAFVVTHANTAVNRYYESLVM